MGSCTDFAAYRQALNIKPLNKSTIESGRAGSANEPPKKRLHRKCEYQFIILEKTVQSADYADQIDYQADTKQIMLTNWVTLEMQIIFCLIGVNLCNLRTTAVLRIIGINSALPTSYCVDDQGCLAFSFLSAYPNRKLGVSPLTA